MTRLLALAKILIDGLQKSPLRALALSLGEDADSVGKTGSVNLLRRCLELGGVDDDIIDECVKPLLEVQDLRSNKGVAHPGTRPTGDLRRQYDTLLKKYAAAVATLTTLVRTGTFTSPESTQILCITQHASPLRAGEACYLACLVHGVGPLSSARETAHIRKGQRVLHAFW